MRAPTALLTLALLAAGASATAQEAGFEMEGLRLGMTPAEVQAIHPQAVLREMPYVDERVGTDYRLIYGQVAVEKVEGRSLVERGPESGADIRLAFTGEPALYQVTAQVLDPAQDCAGVIRRLQAAYGPPALDQRPTYAEWRTALGGPTLEMRCLDGGRGLHLLELAQPSRQQAYLAQLRQRLESAINETLQVVR